MSAPFQTFVRPVMAQGDTLVARDNVDKPLIVIPRERVEGKVTKHQPQGAPAIYCDVVDLSANNNTGEIYVDVMWMGGAVVDGFTQYIGQVMPVVLVWTAPQGKGNNFIVPVALGESALSGWLPFAEQWWHANSGAIDARRAQKAADAAAAGAQVQAPQVSAPPMAAMGVPAAPPAPAAAPVPQAAPAQYAAPVAPPAPQYAAPPAPPAAPVYAPPAPQQPQYAPPAPAAAAPPAYAPPQQPQYAAPAAPAAPQYAPPAQYAAPQPPAGPPAGYAPPAPQYAPPAPAGITQQHVDGIMAELNNPQG